MEFCCQCLQEASFVGSVALLMFVLVDCGLVSAEIESDYMWGLLHPCLLAGEGGYCLSTLSSAINLLKNLRSGPMSIKGTLSLKVSSPNLSLAKNSICHILILPQVPSWLFRTISK